MIVDHRSFVGQRRRRRFDPDARRGAVEKAADRPPVADERGCGAKRAAVAFGKRQGFERMARGDQAGLGFRRAGRARHRSDRGRQADEVKPLAFERFARRGQPGLASPVRAALKRELDEARVAAMKAAQQMHGIGEVAAAMRAGRFEQAVEMRMARATVTRTRASCASATLTGLWSTDRLIAIPSPLRLSSMAKPMGLSLTQGRKDEVYGRVSFLEEVKNQIAARAEAGRRSAPPLASISRRGRRARNCPSGGP